MATELITAFNGGEASRNLESRRDIDLYNRLCSVAENVDINPEGGSQTRAGTKYIATTSGGKAYARAFSYSDEFSYVMEIGDLYIDIYDNQSETLVDSLVSPWAIEEVPELTFYRSYDVMWVTSPNHPTQIITRTSTTSFTIEDISFDYPPTLPQNITDTTLTVAATTGTGVALTASADLFVDAHVGSTFAINHERSAAQSSVNEKGKVATFQSAWLDVSYANWRIETGGTWTGRAIIERSFDGGSTVEAGEKIADTTSIDAGNFSFDSPVREGANTLVRVNFTFATGSFDYNLSSIDLYTYGLVEITAVTDAQNATCDIISDVGATTATKRWSEGAFSAYRGYPRTVTRHQDRLSFCGTSYEPNMLWMSFTGDYYNFFAGTLADESIRRAPPVNGFASWMISKGDLFIGTDSEFVTVTGQNPSLELTPENFKFVVESSFGGAFRAPALANNVVLYLQKSNKTVREILYDDTSKSYASNDVSRIAKHIAGVGIKEMTLQRLPEQRLHCILENGEKGVLTYERNEEVVAWRRYKTDGDYISTCIVDNGAEDAVWNTVLRDGAYMLEKEQSRVFEGVKYWCVDSGTSNVLLGKTAMYAEVDEDLDYIIKISSVGHGLQNGDKVLLEGLTGMTSLNGNVYTVADRTDDNFCLKTIDGSDYVLPHLFPEFNHTGITLDNSSAVWRGFYNKFSSTGPGVYYYQYEPDEFQFGQVDSFNPLYSWSILEDGFYRLYNPLPTTRFPPSTGWKFISTDLPDSLTVTVERDDIDSAGFMTQVSNTVTGLGHLEGKTVAAVGDGMYDGDHVVTGGAITLNDYYNCIISGLRYECTTSPMPIEPLSAEKLSAGKRKLISGKVTLKLKDTIGGSFGSVLGELEDIIGETAPRLGEAQELINDDIEVYHADGWDDIKRVYFKQTLPLPAEILSMSIVLDVRA
jgi:hypothetical protein